jgi:hypothetical protein
MKRRNLAALMIVLTLAVGCGSQGEATKPDIRPPAPSEAGNPNHEKLLADIRSLPALIDGKKTQEIVAVADRIEKAADDLLATLKDDEQPKPSEPSSSEAYQPRGERDKEKAKEPKDMTKGEACRELKQVGRDIKEAANKGEHMRAVSMKDRAEKLADRCFSPSNSRDRGK